MGKPSIVTISEAPREKVVEDSISSSK
ncbi:hypothetical protein CCACVL1_01062, partial [Corchorus capsularis]